MLIFLLHSAAESECLIVVSVTVAQWLHIDFVVICRYSEAQYVLLYYGGSGRKHSGEEEINMLYTVGNMLCTAKVICPLHSAIK